ncbi:hypothetical protein NC653_039401 [Populus alba x Populus x berolinensis]|uniref:Uncharacterized protein n=1 Tax=Populus alba x Populus x berolinensis TaxID=444605 RepID=A0AAD6LCN3_9ROSI|nr:hypothetical protein NC653_039401 [Populus alba x Populus x berolinensis]
MGKEQWLLVQVLPRKRMSLVCPWQRKGGGPRDGMGTNDEREKKRAEMASWQREIRGESLVLRTREEAVCGDLEGGLIGEKRW